MTVRITLSLYIEGALSKVVNDQRPENLTMLRLNETTFVMFKASNWSQSFSFPSLGSKGGRCLEKCIESPPQQEVTHIPNFIKM